MQGVTNAQFADWAVRLRASDHTAYRAIYDATYDVLYRSAWQVVRDDAAAYDVLQETYLKLWEMRDRIDPARSLRALLYQMTRNFALNHLRHRRRHAALAFDDLVEKPYTKPEGEQQVDTAALEERLQAWIEAMPPRRRESFMLSRVQGLSHEEIGAVMGVAPKTVNNQIVKALQELRARVEAYRNAPVYA